MISIKREKKGMILAAGLFLAVLGCRLGLPIEVQAQPEHHDYSDEELYQTVNGIIQWKKEDTGSKENLFEDEFLGGAASTRCDWYAVSLGRLGREDDYAAYLAAAEQKVEDSYQTEDKLDAVKATEWHRISLAILAAGGDPTQVGDSKINLIADGTYNRGKTKELGAQGVNGIIWGLISLDSLRWQVPENAHDSRSGMIQMLLEQQLADGGFAFSSGSAEPDITAMALTALSPYRNDETVYTYTQKDTGSQVEKNVGQVVEEALQCLADMQGKSAEYTSWGSVNSESISQTLSALSALGIDAASDTRFIKDGVTLLDVLMDFQMSDGGFIHSHEYDEENESADPNESNSMAGEQALYALTAYLRYHEGMRGLFDYREEMPDDLRTQILAVRTQIEELPENADAPQVQNVYEEYCRVPASERSYVYNYHKLSGTMKALGIQPQEESLAAAMENHTSGSGAQVDIENPEHVLDTEITFTEEDRQKAEAIPETVTAEYEIPVLKALYQIEKSGKQEENQELTAILKEKKQTIQKRKEEISNLNDQIKEQISAAESISIKDRELVKSIKSRYEALSEYEQGRIEGYEDVERADKKISSTLRAMILAIAAGAAACILLLVIIWHSRKRKQERRNRKMLDWEEDDD